MLLGLDDCTIYAVDDDALVLKSLCALLNAHGYEVRSFGSAEAFFRSADLNSVGCVITDLRMPVINGGQLQVRLASADSTLSVVVVTGHADPPTLTELIENGVVTVLEKPYSCDALLSAIEQALSQSRILRERRQQTINSSS